MTDNILVTGGAGYIGSHACKVLAQQGYTPVTYDNLVYGHKWAVKWGPFEEGDILERNRLDKVLAKYKPGAVMHFAAYAYVGESVKDPAKYYRNNVVGSLTLLDAMKEHAIDKMIFSSTCSTYGLPIEIPITENHPQQPINPYGTSKYIIEKILDDFDRAYGLHSISLRYFNAAGADSEAEIGEDHNPETHLIPLVLDVAGGKREQIEIFSDDYDTKDGICIRDYIHVADIADAHVKALDSLIRNNKTTAYNLGIGHGYSVKEVIKASENVTGKKIPSIMGQRREGDPPVLICDSDNIRNDLGWEPQYTDLDSIIKTAWDWHQRK